MASRTRVHCPNCQTQYLPYARRCEACGRQRDQKSDAELAAERAGPLPPPSAPKTPRPILLYVAGGLLAIPLAILCLPALLFGLAVWGLAKIAVPKSKPLQATLGALSVFLVLVVQARRTIEGAAPIIGAITGAAEGRSIAPTPAPAASPIPASSSSDSNFEGEINVKGETFHDPDDGWVKTDAGWVRIATNNQPVGEGGGGVTQESGTPLLGERYPQTRLRDLTESEVKGWGFAGQRYAVNEIYARHGYVFKERDFTRRFETTGFYRPHPGRSQEDIEREFSAIEKRNADLIAEVKGR